MTVSDKHMAAARHALNRAWEEHESKFGGGAHIVSDGLMESFAAAAAAALAAAEREGMRRAVQIIREGYPRPVAIPYRRDGKPSKHDKCAHHFYMIEDCEECAIAAILSQAGEA